MILTLLSLSLLGCSTAERDSTSGGEIISSSGEIIVVEDFEISQFSHLESPCLDGILINMSSRGCKVSIVDWDDKSTRYFCREADNIDVTDLWMSRAFYAFSNETVLDKKYLSDNNLNEACSDWSQTIFYR